MDEIKTVIQPLLKDELITVEDQGLVKGALQAAGSSHELLLWVTCPKRRYMSGREFVAEFCRRMG